MIDVHAEARTRHYTSKSPEKGVPAKSAEGGGGTVLSLSLAKIRDTSEGQRGYQFAPPLQTMLKERKERGG